MLPSRLSVRRYPSIRNRAIRGIAEDLLGSGISATLTSRRLERGVFVPGAAVGRGVATAVPLLVALLLTALRLVLPGLEQQDLSGLTGSSQSSITNLPAPIYFLPLVVFAVMAVLCGVRLRTRSQGWSINWNRAVLLAYVLGGLAGGFILAFGVDVPRAVGLGIWFGYILVLAALSTASYVLFRWLFRLLGWRHTLASRDFAVLFLSCAVSTTVVLCGVVGVAALPEKWTGGGTAGEIAFYVFPWVTLSFVFAVMVFYPRWIDFRRTVQGHSGSMERAAARALTRWMRRSEGTMSQVGIERIARELGWRLGPTLVKSNITRYLMFLSVEADRAGRRNTTEWTDVARFQEDIFEEAILATALANYEVRDTRDTTEWEKAVIADQSELVLERVRKAVALRCARFLYARHRRGSTGRVILVGEDALMYAAAATNLAADLTCRLPTLRLIEECSSETTLAKRVSGVLRLGWRKV